MPPCEEYKMTKESENIPMKKAIAMLLLIAMLALTACGQAAAPAQAKTAEQAAQIANPWRSVTEEEARSLCPGSLRAPEGSDNIRWSVMETEGQPALVQLNFDYNGYTYTAREQQTNDQTADVSGLYYTWTGKTQMALKNWGESAKAGTYFRYIGEGEWVDLCAWFDTAKGVSYTLSVASKDLDGFDLEVIVDSMGSAQSAAAAASVRQDGERFVGSIMLEGMEEAVNYEHVVNAGLGFEMDYEYESLTRMSGVDRERYVSIYDDPAAPENYLDVQSSAKDAETVAAGIRAALSETYDLTESTRELENSGSCLYIEASVLKGTNNMADHLQMVYVIPASDGCRVAAVHTSVEAAEGFGRRFAYMLDTLRTMDRNGNFRLSDEQALKTVTNYCASANPELQSIVEAGEYATYWEVSASSEAEVVIVFRSYTGALNYYYVDRVSGETTVTELVPGIIDAEQPTGEHFNAWAYVG